MDHEVPKAQHAGMPGFPGGFDIFFVTAGYLICGMIDVDIRQDVSESAPCVELIGRASSC
jgi:peptidoglycan/LPS O-acetylase OafA/YrhL